MKRALVLGGGGARGAYQVGMLDVLVREKGLDFDVVRGVSVGALNAAFLAQAPTQGASLANLQAAVEKLHAIWTKEIRGNKSVYTERVGGFAGLAAGADSLFDNAPLAALMKKFLKADAIAASGRDFAVGTVSLVSGDYVEYAPAGTKDFLELVLASTAIPVVFPPVWRAKEKEVLVDGGVRQITPLSAAFHAKPDEVYVLMTSRAVRDGTDLPGNAAMRTRYEDWDDNFLGTKINGLDVLKRAVELLTDEVYLNDVEGALEWNDVLRDAGLLLSRAKEVAGQPDLAEAAQNLEATLAATKKRHVPIHVLAPREWYGETNAATAFDPGLIERAIEHGREVARDPTLWLWP